LATVEDWGEEIFSERVGVNWKKWARREGGGEGKVPHPHLAPSAPILYQSSIQDGGTRHRKLYSLSSVLLQNNACTAG